MNDNDYIGKTKLQKWGSFRIRLEKSPTSCVKTIAQNKWYVCNFLFLIPVLRLGKTSACTFKCLQLRINGKKIVLVLDCTLTQLNSKWSMDNIIGLKFISCTPNLPKPFCSIQSQRVTLFTRIFDLLSPSFFPLGN